MKKIVFVLSLLLLLSITTASIIQLIANAPIENHITQDHFEVINITLLNNDSQENMTLKIYGEDDISVNNSSLIYVKNNITNGSMQVYNWTSPKIGTYAQGIKSLYYFDYNSEESNESEIPSDPYQLLLMHFNNNSIYGENETLAYDFSSNGNNGTIHIATLNAHGKFSGSIQLNGINSYMEYGTNALKRLNVNKDWSYEFWTKIPSSEIEGTLISQRNSTNSYPVLDIVLGYNGLGNFGNGELGIIIRSDDNTGQLAVDTNTTLNDDQWHHVAFVKNITNHRLCAFIDGIEKACGTESLSSPITTDLLRIGKEERWVQDNYASIDRTYLEGEIDEFAIYNRSLSRSEIKRHASTFVRDEMGINNGTRGNGANFNESGKMGPSMQFDGINDFIAINDSNDLDYSSDFSISFWAYPFNLVNNQTFIAKGVGTNTNYFIQYLSTSEIEFGYYNGGWKSIVVSADNYKVNQWNLITVTRNATDNNSKIFVNGVDKGNLKIDAIPLANDADVSIGYFPGFGTYYEGLIDEVGIFNTTLSDEEVEDNYRLKNGFWYWMFSVENGNEMNWSTIRKFEVGSVWAVNPENLGSVSAALNTNISLGTLVVNNTHESRNISINISSSYTEGLLFDSPVPFNLSASNGNWSEVKINITSPLVEGISMVYLNITAFDLNGGPSVPFSRMVPIQIIASSANPVIITRIETSPLIISQNSSGIVLKASATNRGQGNAQNVIISFILPQGWTNSSGGLEQNLGILLVNENKNGSILVDIDTNAEFGEVTIFANSSAQNASGNYLSENYLVQASVNVTVNQVKFGSGPASNSGSSSQSSTSSSSSGGGSIKKLNLFDSKEFKKIIRIGSGNNASFNLEIKNEFLNASYENITIELSGIPQHYITINPKSIEIINPQESKNILFGLQIPTYIETVESHELEATIRGIKREGATKMPFIETYKITLIIEKIDQEKTTYIFVDAEKAVAEMKSAGFNTEEVEKKLKQAYELLSVEKSTESFEISKEIIAIRNEAFTTYNLIRKLLVAFNDPKINYFLLSEKYNSPEEFNPNNSLKNGLTGKAIFVSSSTKELLDLSIIAFERGDFETSKKRASQVESSLILERKGNLGVFLYLYWHIVLFVSFIIVGLSLLSFRSYRKYMISRNIIWYNTKEKIIKNNMQKNQKEYFSGKISKEVYQLKMENDQKNLSLIIKKRIKLRNKRIKMLRPIENFKELKNERKQIEEEIKNIQNQYYKDKSIAENLYKFEFQYLTQRLAEIEDEQMMSEIKDNKKSFKIVNNLKQNTEYKVNENK